MADVSWTDIAQTFAVVGALVFSGLETHWRRKEQDAHVEEQRRLVKQQRRLAKEQRFQRYTEIVNRYLELSKLMMEKPELHELYKPSKQDMTDTYPFLPTGARVCVYYCESVIALCETIWYGWEDGWLEEDEWNYWLRWAHELHESPYFRWTLDWVKDDYDPVFLRKLRAPKAEAA